MATYHYYVHDTGTATTTAGRFSSAQTGTRTALGVSSLFGNMKDAIAVCTETITSGDNHKVYVSDDHAFASSTATDFDWSPTNDTHVEFISVSDADITTYSIATTAQEAAQTTAGIDIDLDSCNSSYFTFYGLYFEYRDIFRGGGTFDHNEMTFVDCTFEKIQGTGNAMFHITGDGCDVELRNCDFKLTTGHILACPVRFDRQTNIIMDNCTNSTANKFDNIVLGPDLTGAIIIKNMDLSDFITGTDHLASTMSTGNDRMDITLDRCVFPSGMGISKATPTLLNYLVRYQNAGTTGQWYNQQQFKNGFTIELSTTIHNDATYDGTNGVSLEVDTLTDCTDAAPGRFLLATLMDQDLSGVGGKTYTVYFTCGSTLNTKQLSLFAMHPTGTDQAQGASVRTIPGPMTAGSTHTTSTWTTGALTNSYEETVTITQQTGVTKGKVDIWVELRVPNLTINIDPAITVT